MSSASDWRIRTERLWQIAEPGEDHVTPALYLALREGGSPRRRRFEARHDAFP